MLDFLYTEPVSRSLWKVWVCCLLALLLQACSKANDSQKLEGTPVSISGYNYTLEGIQEFYVNGAWGGGISIGGGDGTVCCVVLPNKWTSGLTVTVEWKRSDCQGDKKQRCPERIQDIDKWPMLKFKKDISIEPYDQPNWLQVMFLPDDEIKIYSFSAGPLNPDHPSKLGRPHPIGHPEWRRPHE